jgi:hypothetical protein
MSKLGSHSPFGTQFMTNINKSNDVQLKLANLALEMLSMESMCMNMNL